MLNILLKVYYLILVFLEKSVNFREGIESDATSLALLFDAAGRRIVSYFWSLYAAEGQSFFEFGRENIRTNDEGKSYYKNWQIAELDNKLLIKCLDYYARGKAKDLKSEIFTCSKSTIKNVKEEVFKRFYKPVYLLLLSIIACLIFFISKENKRFTKLALRNFLKKIK